MRKWLSCVGIMGLVLSQCVEAAETVVPHNEVSCEVTLQGFISIINMESQHTQQASTYKGYSVEQIEAMKKDKGSCAAVAAINAPPTASTNSHGN